jgi:hypothetical protein
VELIEKFIAAILVRGAFIGLGLIAVFGSINFPVLGVLHCFLIAAYLLDFNKKILGKFFVSFRFFFKKNNLVMFDHRLLFFVFLISWTVNILMLFMRAFYS